MNNRKYLLLIIAGFILWIAETAYFGFNEKPENAVESTLDFIAFTMMFWGIIGDIFSNLTIVKNYNIKTKDVNIVGDNQKVDYTIKKARIVTGGQNETK